MPNSIRRLMQRSRKTGKNIIIPAPHHNRRNSSSCRTGLALCDTELQPPRIFFKLWLHSLDIPSGKLRISSAFSNRNSSVSSHECPSAYPLTTHPLSSLHPPLRHSIPNQINSLLPTAPLGGPKSIPQWGWLWAVVRGWSGLARAPLWLMPLSAALPRTRAQNLDCT